MIIVHTSACNSTEKRVVNALKYAPGIMITNLRVGNGRQVREVDALVFTPRYATVIEAKGTSKTGEVKVSLNGGWTVGGETNAFFGNKPPHVQAREAAQTVASLLQSKNMRGIYINHVVALDGNLTFDGPVQVGDGHVGLVNQIGKVMSGLTASGRPISPTKVHEVLSLLDLGDLTPSLEDIQAQWKTTFKQNKEAAAKSGQARSQSTSTASRKPTTPRTPAPAVAPVVTVPDAKPTTSVVPVQDVKPTAVEGSFSLVDERALADVIIPRSTLTSDVFLPLKRSSTEMMLMWTLEDNDEFTGQMLKNRLNYLERRQNYEVSYPATGPEMYNALKQAMMVAGYAETDDRKAVLFAYTDLLLEDCGLIYNFSDLEDINTLGGAFKANYDHDEDYLMNFYLSVYKEPAKQKAFFHWYKELELHQLNMAKNFFYRKTKGEPIPTQIMSQLELLNATVDAMRQISLCEQELAQYQ